MNPVRVLANVHQCIISGRCENIVKSKTKFCGEIIRMNPVRVLANVYQCIISGRCENIVMRKINFIGGL